MRIELNVVGFLRSRFVCSETVRWSLKIERIMSRIRLIVEKKDRLDGRLV